MHIEGVMHALRRFPFAAASAALAALAWSGAAVPVAAQAPAASCAPAPTALVLAGGGSKGLTHIGLLQALDSLGIRPDLVVGSSMGAILGALWAAGEPAESIAARIKAAPLHALIRDYDPVVSNSLGALTAALVWEKEPKHWVLQTGTVREIEASSVLSRLALRGNLLARGDFDRLSIPFRAVATDLDDRSVVAIGQGDLAQALRASMSIPLLLRPVVLDGRTLVDGGLSSNIPVGVARSLGAQRIIVSTIASPKPDPAAFDDPLTVTSAVFEYLWVQDSLRLGAEDVLVAQPTAAYGMLDFRPAMIDSLIRVGRRAADAALAGAACLRPAGPAPARVEPVMVGRARIATPGVRDRDAILRELGLAPRTPLDREALDAGLGRLTAQERYRGAWLNPTGDSTRVDFDVTLDRAPVRSAGLGFAFDHTMSGRVWIGAVDRNLLDRDLEGTALLKAGTWRTDLTLAARRRARIGRRYLPVGGALELVTEDVRRFDGELELAPADIEELGLLVGLRPLYEPGWSYELGAEYRLWRQPLTPVQGSVGARYGVRYRRAGAPDPLLDFTAIGLDDWQRVHLQVALTDSIRGVEVRPRLRAGWGRDLPIQHTYTLGGLDGFAGLRLLEGRGDIELFGSVLVRWPLWRRLRGRIEPMVGMVGNGDLERAPGTLDGLLLFGGRVGVELDTPIGPIRLEQGFNNQDRRQALIRVGHWF